mgnify:CR=1 FL=1
MRQGVNMQGRIVFATGNAGKIKEIRMIMEDTGLEVVSMKDAGIKADIEENGKTYEENALIKARAVAAFTKDIVMADDSGLEIDALNKEPGIYSARYLGEDTPYSIKNANLIQRLEGVPEEKRTARFVCAIAAVLPDGRELTTRATIEGRIGYEEKGTNGFGYDPIFYVPEFGKTTAELTEEEKNQVSHRGKALELMKGNAEDAVREGAHALFYPHGLGHMMGLDVHDMENLGEIWVGYNGQPKSTQFGRKSQRLAIPLEPGFVHTVEPGIYFIPELIDMWKGEKKFTDFINYDVVETYKDFGGIRNEEDYLITETGARRLGKKIPLTPEEVEALR